MPDTGQQGVRASGGPQGYPELLGLPLAEAEVALRRLGRAYRVELTAPPGRAALGEDRRVIGLREAEAEVVLVVAREVPAAEGAGPSDSPSGRK